MSRGFLHNNQSVGSGQAFFNILSTGMAEEDRKALTEMTMKLFSLWKLAPEQQADLLGLSAKTRSTINRYQRGIAPFEDRKDLLERASYLLSFHDILEALLPENPELADRWMNVRNRHFQYKTPIELIQAQSWRGIFMVHDYLNHELNT